MRQEKTKLQAQIEHENHANSVLRAQLSDLRNSQMSTAQTLEDEEEMEEE